MKHDYICLMACSQTALTQTLTVYAAVCRSNCFYVVLGLLQLVVRWC